MRFCIFGAGRMGAKHAQNVKQRSDCNVAIIVDVDLNRAKALAGAVGAAALSSPSEALADTGLDAAIIASPTDTHVDLILACADAGLPILCEKPIDLRLDRVEACHARLRGYERPVMIGFQRRFDATHRAVRLAVQDGAIGVPEVVTITSRDPSPPSLEYLRSSGGQFKDQMIHDFDMALWLADVSGAVEVSALSSNLVDPSIGQHGDCDTAVALLRFETGMLCKIENSRRCAYGYDQRVEVFGSDGMVCSGNQRPITMERYASAGTAMQSPLLPGFMERYSDTYAAELDDFVSAIRGEKEPEVRFEDGRRALMLSQAAAESDRTRKVVRVSI